MADLLQIGSAATAAFRKGLDVTAHNIANVGTEGFNRQRAELVSNAPQVAAGSFSGGGVRVSSVERVFSQHIQTQMVSSHSLMQRYDQQLELSKHIEGIVASNDKGVQEFMFRFFGSMQDLSNNPTSDTSRRLLLDESRNMESYIDNLSTALQASQVQVNHQVKDLTREINSRLDSINSINQHVGRALNDGSQVPNDLLDKRDQAIFELGRYMDIKPFHQADGRVDIHTGNGRLPLISDGTVTYLQANFSDYPDDNRMEVFMNIGGQNHNISQQIQGGQLGGVLDFRSNMLDKSMRDMGLMLNGLTASVNWQHYMGYDDNGDPGKAFFTPLDANVLQSRNNDSASSDGSFINFAFNPKIPSTTDANPVTANFSQTPPFNSPPVAGVDPSNFGDQQIYLESAIRNIGEMVSREYELHNVNGTNFEIRDKKTGELLTLTDRSIAGYPDAPASQTSTIVPGVTYSIEGFEITIDPAGNFQRGDQFIIRPHQDMLNNFQTSLLDTREIATRGQSPVDANNDGSILDEALRASGAGDNVNIANMASLQSKELLFANSAGVASESLLGAYSKMATNLGMYVRSTEIQLSAQTNVFEQIQNRRESMSGVSLDEEAINLMRFQQSFQAAAQLISTSQTLFQTLLGVISR